MKLSLQTIALRRLRCLIRQEREPNLLQSNAFSFELGQLGFSIANQESFTSITREEFETVVTTLKAMRGANVSYVPLFTRFPDDLPNDHMYLLRRVLGFLGINTFEDPSAFGANPITQMQQADLWQAAVAAQASRLKDTHTEWISLMLTDQSEAEQKLRKWATDLIYGVTPVKEALWEDVFTVLKELQVETEIARIQVKETLARISARHWQHFGTITVKTPTDLLRMFAFLQGQDVSLAEPIALKGLKLSKAQRQTVVAFLNQCPALAEDLLRYRELWISFSRWLHPGDWAKRFPTVAQAFDDLRNQRIKSFDSIFINARPEIRIAHLLKRPSMLLRKVTWLLKHHPAEEIAAAILTLRDKAASLPLPLLTTVYCAVQYEGKRGVINKKGNPFTIGERQLDCDTVPVLEALDCLILTKLSGTKNWGTVWIDPALEKLVLPLQVRKQSDGFLNLARGSRLALTEPVIRVFVYWHQARRQTDLDLSALELDEEFSYVGHVGWNQYGEGQDVAHSGDIQSAPQGAAEFIDVRLDAVKSAYLLLAVIRFAGEEFTALKACFSGWMNRQQVGADHQTFDAKTVAEKVVVNQAGQTWIPFLVDVVARELVFVDLYAKGKRVVEGNQHFPALAAATASYWQAKPTFGKLACWYARANHATVVAERNQAETTIGMTDECTINVLRLVGQGVTSFSSFWSNQ